MTAERHTIMMRPSQRIRLPIDSETSFVGVHHMVVRNDERLPVTARNSRAAEPLAVRTLLLCILG
jgi:hypothetical protein